MFDVVGLVFGWMLDIAHGVGDTHGLPFVLPERMVGKQLDTLAVGSLIDKVTERIKISVAVRAEGGMVRDIDVSQEKGLVVAVERMDKVIEMLNV